MNVVFYHLCTDGQYKVEFNSMWVQNWAPLSNDVSWWIVPGSINLED